MTTWRAGRSTGRTLWRDEQLVGMVDSPEVAAEIVAAMGVVNRLLGPAPETGREQTCGYCLSWHVVGTDNRFEIHVNSSGQYCTGSLAVAP